MTKAQAHLKGKLVLLPSPDFEPLIVAAELPEVLGADGEQPSGHDRALERLRRVLQVLGQQRQTLVEQLPVESSSGTWSEMKHSANPALNSPTN